MTWIIVGLFVVGGLVALVAWDPAGIKQWLIDLRRRPQTIGKAAYNERLKLSATFLNNIAVGTIAVASALPIYKFFILTAPQIEARLHKMTAWEMADRGSGVVGAFLLAIALHLWARLILSNVQD